MTLWETKLHGEPVLVTSADGFIGSHFVYACVEAGADVHALVRATSSGTLNNIEHVRDRITIHEGDVTDMHSVRSALAELRGTRPLLFRLAAQAPCRRVVDETFETAAVSCSTARTACAVHDDFDLETSHVIPALIRWFVEARARGLEEVGIWGTGTPTRELMAADDAGRGIRLATEGQEGPEPVNLGSGEEISIRELASKITRTDGVPGRDPVGRDQAGRPAAAAARHAFAGPSSGIGSGRMRILVLNQYFHPDRSATSSLVTKSGGDLGLVAETAPLSE